MWKKLFVFYLDNIPVNQLLSYLNNYLLSLHDTASTPIPTTFPFWHVLSLSLRFRSYRVKSRGWTNLSDREGGGRATRSKGWVTCPAKLLITLYLTSQSGALAFVLQCIMWRKGGNNGASTRWPRTRCNDVTMNLRATPPFFWEPTPDPRAAFDRLDWFLAGPARIRV